MHALPGKWETKKTQNNHHHFIICSFLVFAQIGSKIAVYLTISKSFTKILPTIIRTGLQGHKRFSGMPYPAKEPRSKLTVEE